MLPSIDYLRETLGGVIRSMDAQGHAMGDAEKELAALPASYDALAAFAEKLSKLPLREDWEYAEPNDFAGIEAEMAADRNDVLVAIDDIAPYQKKAEAAFLGSVLGCILGKPLEVNPTYDELEKAGRACGEWPIADFISETFLEQLGRRHGSWVDTVKGKINYVAADDDLHYSVMGMINLENYGLDLNYDGVRNTWRDHQCMNFVFGPERLITACVAVDHLDEGQKDKSDARLWQWSELFNPGNEYCGAAIRADAYGYAFPGRPDLAAKYAYIDASFTHRRTGVYSTMYIAAVIALLFVAKEPMAAFEGALKFVPQRSRFHRIMKICLEYVTASKTFEEGYRMINHRFGEYRHCHIYQEVGTLANTLKYAADIWDGVCKQVMQGNDTDSFGCTAGSMLGAFFGPDKLPMDRLALFNDEIQISLASFHEHSLSALAARMGRLPVKFMKE